VRRLLDENAAAWSHEIRWDGRDGSGRLAPAGVYLLWTRAGRQVATRRIVLLE
jgi:hypothetical protein